MDSIVALVSALKDWAGTLPGFLVVCGIVALGYLGSETLKHLKASAATSRRDLEKAIGELRVTVALHAISIQECRADGLYDRGSTETIRTLYVELRTMMARHIGGPNREVPRELLDIDARYLDWRSKRHHEHGRRAEREHEQIKQAREQLQQQLARSGSSRGTA